MVLTNPESIEPTHPSGALEIPEHMVTILLDGAQQQLLEAQEAIHRNEPVVRDRHLKKVLLILEELNRRLNPEHPGELVVYLTRIYGWWGREILDAGEKDDALRLKVVSTQMGEIRKAWEQVLFGGEGLSGNPDF